MRINYFKHMGMAGKFRLGLLFVSFMFFLCSCHQPKGSIGEKIISENYLTIIDTLIYRTRSFRPAPFPVKQYETDENPIVINMDRVVTCNDTLDKYVTLLLKTDSKFSSQYSSHFKGARCQPFRFTDQFPERFDRILIESEAKIKSKNKIGFFGFRISGKTASLITVKSDDSHEIGELYIFESENGAWAFKEKKFLYTS